jgi:16S rRNA (cytosine1402-N4)-methyltransferase
MNCPVYVENTMNTSHIPVMAQQVVEYLVTDDAGGLYLDCTVGAGGHAAQILKATSPHGKLVGIDTDPEALKLAEENLSPYGERVSLIHGNFADLERILDDLNIHEFDGVLMDLGVSSIQLDTPDRGFSFRSSGPLDMRMDRTAGQPVSDDLDRKNIAELTEIIRKFGEERWAKQIAFNIVKTRKRSPIKTTTQLAKIVERVVPRSSGNIHPATRTFQALRIYKNEELSNLEIGLDMAVKALKPKGRICAISFHSLEDRIVKRKFRSMERGCVCPPKTPVCVCGQKPSLKVITKRPVTPSKGEIKANPRSRSAKLRVASKL